MLQIIDLTQQYTMGAKAICDLSVSVETNSLLCILGKEEAGKTTLLKTICGLTDIKQGKILIGDNNIINTPLKNLNIAFMYETGGFFENKSVIYNLEYPLKIRQLNDDYIKQTVNHVIDKFDLSRIKNNKISKLNELDKLNLAFARLFTRNSKLILIDNPFKKFNNRNNIFEFFLPYINELNKNSTIIYATDNPYETYRLNGNILILNYGITEQYGTYEELQKNPNSLIVLKYMNPKSKIYEGKIIVVNEKLCVSYNNILRELKKNNLLNNIYIGKKVLVAELDFNNKPNINIFDYNNERKIYFD